MTGNGPSDSAARRAGPELLVEWAGRVAGMATSGWVTEDHAVEVLADAAAREPTVLREAVLLSQDDPDAVPLVAALLERAVMAAQRPIVARPSLPPTAPGP